MKIMKLSLLCLTFVSIATNSNALTSAQLEERARKKAHEKAWADITKRIGDAKERFEDLFRLAKTPSAKLAEKIKKIKDKRNKELKELTKKRVSKKMRWTEYSKKKREIIEDYDEDMEEFDDVEEKAIEPILRFKFAQRMKQVVRNAVLDEKAKMEAEFAELERLELEMKKDIAEATEEWSAEVTEEWSKARSVGSYVEKKLDFMRTRFLGGRTKTTRQSRKKKLKS